MLPESATSWSCVKDSQTGLIWEVKTNDGGLQDKDSTYSWFNSTGINDAGSYHFFIVMGGYDDDGYLGNQNRGTCTGSSCDTEAYVASVNAQGLCGANNWQMPSIEQLQSIVDYSSFSPAIDTAYFPNTVSGYYWSSSPDPVEEVNARLLWFTDGFEIYHFMHLDRHVRLVLTEH